MILLHMAWTGSQFFIWGEKEPEPSIYKKRGRPPKNPGGAPHPFQASVRDVNSLMNVLYPGIDWDKDKRQAKIYLLLPTGKRVPQASPGLSMEDENEEYRLAGWEVTGLLVDVPEFIEGIAAGSQGEYENGTYDFIYGDDWNYWMLCGRFLLRMLCRQKFIPSLAPGNGGGVVAVWQPVFEDPEDRRIIKRLINVMPPICCGVLGQTYQSKEPLLPYDVIMNYLRVATDEVIRSWLGNMDYGEENIPIERLWLYALRGKRRRIIGSKKQIEELIEGIRQWTRPLRENRESFRTCLRLEEPKEGTEEWYLSFHLQATDDPSLLIAAQDIWQTGSQANHFLNKEFEHPQEKLLEGLGKISKIYPVIERGLMEPRPEGVFLSTEEAYFFLRETAILLQESGFGVLVPSWWRERRKRTLGVRLKLHHIRGEADFNTDGHIGLNTIVGYDWKLAIGDSTVDYEELKQLAALKKPLINIRGQWVELDPKEIDSAIKWLERHRGEKRLRLKETLDMVCAAEDGPPVTLIDSEGWLEILLKGLAGTDSPTILDTPSGFCGKLRPYQVRGFSWMVFLRRLGFGACLADDMGLGKTVQLIALLLYEREELGVKGPTLLICPTSVVGNWMREISRFAPSLKTFIHHGVDRLMGQEFIENIAGYDLVISTYSLVSRDWDTIAQVDWEGIVLDEAQNIKNPSTKQAQVVRKLKGKYRIALTGTPVENRLMELWSIMEFLNPGYLGSRQSFYRKFVLPIERYGDEKRAWQLKQLINPFILRRTKTDPTVIKDLPVKQENKVYCALTREQATLYQSVVDDIMEKISTLSGMERRGLILSGLTRLKQICNHPALFLADGSVLDNRSGKLMRLQEMMYEVLSEGDRALVFTQYTHMGKMLQTYLQRCFQREVLFLHGGVPKEKRDYMIERFQSADGPDIFVLSLRAGGVGLNLIQANHVFHYDRWWNPAVEDQATDRAYRIGQKKNVQVHKFICQGTLEEKIDLLIERKKDLADKVVGIRETWLTDLSDDELRKLFTLERDAVENE
ncbi:MAG: DEAD/DEAH box helicase [Clostridiales bacterium]|nr:DEAD/DEAH box helicase [Clostridiales bacterium]